MALASNGKPLLSTLEAAERLTRSHVSWAGSGDGAATTVLTYSFRATAPATMPNGTTDFLTFNPQQIRGAELALQAWADVGNLRFDRLGLGFSGPEAFSDGGTLRLASYGHGDEKSAAFAYMPSRFPNRSPNSLQGDAWFDASRAYNLNPQVFGSGQRVLLHEIGHALGLSHPGSYDAGENEQPITYSDRAEYYEDSRQYSVMSYFSETNTAARYFGYQAASPMLHDIAAIQSLYGPNRAAFVGDTVYGFNSNTDRPWFTAAVGPGPVIFSVWDAGGTDSFDFSGYTQAQTIDLNPGGFSNVGGLQGNVSIALGAVIENADGGFGSDRILGNAAANFIRGMDGADHITGGAGDDNLNGNGGPDTVLGDDGNDWVRGGRDNDVVNGGAGDDPHVNGGQGDDTVLGGPGNDSVYGGQGDDQLFGEEGGDLLSGDLGSDIMTGGPGADRFLFQAGSGADWISDFSSAEGDRVQLPGGASFILVDVEGQALLDLGGGDRLGFVGLSVGGLSDWLVYA